MADHCPTCGGEVTVKTSDEGTSYFEPAPAVLEPRLGAQIVAEEHLDALLGAIDHHRDLWEDARPVRNPLLEAVRNQDDDLYSVAEQIRNERKESDA